MSFTTFQQCRNARGWKEIEIESSKGDSSYTVAIPPWGSDDAACDCKGFLFRGNCRHIAEAANDICEWSSLLDDCQNNQQRALGLCPKCGSKTLTMTVEDNHGGPDDEN